MTDSERLAALERDGVRIVRVTYPDLHGVLRGKDVPIGFFASTVAADGLAFCKAISTVDLRHNVKISREKLAVWAAGKLG